MSTPRLPELKPCPFCGGKADMVQPGTRRHSCIVECLNCGCRLESGDEGEQSGSSWNRRRSLPDPSATPQEEQGR